MPTQATSATLPIDPPIAMEADIELGTVDAAMLVFAEVSAVAVTSVERQLQFWGQFDTLWRKITQH
jgi:hypothetical protein